MARNTAIASTKWDQNPDLTRAEAVSTSEKVKAGTVTPTHREEVDWAVKTDQEKNQD
jgi:hypothetical protein